MTNPWHRLCAAVLQEAPEMPCADVERELIPFMVRLVQHEFTEGSAYLELTEEAMARSGIVADPVSGAQEAYDYYIASQFFDRLLLSTNSNAAMRQAQAVTDLSALDPLVDSDQPVVIAAFHQSRYLMFTVGMFVHPLPVVGLKARRDIIEQFGQMEQSQAQTVYTADRGTPIHMLRALAKGENVSMMIDHVHPQAEVHGVEFLGRRIKVNLGAAWVAHKAHCEVVPMGLHKEGDRYRATLYPAVCPGTSVYDTIQSVYKGLETAVIREPLSWSRWFTTFSDQRELEIRPRLRAANNLIWTKITQAMGLQ